MNILTSMRALLIVLVLAAGQAFALDLDTAKSQGLVGEQPNGYLGQVSGGAEVEELVKDINGKRKAVYADIARKQGISIADVEAMAGRKAMAKTPAGQYVHDGSGWMKK